MMNKQADVLITGGGFTGLLAAIAIKGYDPKRSVSVVEKGTYIALNQNLKPIILTPLCRQLLHKLPLYDQYNYNEGRYQVYKFMNEEYGLQFTVPDTGIIAYGAFLRILLNIALENGIDVAESVTALDYNFNENYVLTDHGSIKYKTLIIAEGNDDFTYNEQDVKIESNVEVYFFKIKRGNSNLGSATEYSDSSLFQKGNHNNSLVQKGTHNSSRIRFRKSSGGAFCVGDFAGYRDRLLDINCSFGIISAIYAAECVAKGSDSSVYYAAMEGFERDIEISSALNRGRIDLEPVQEILLGRAYSDVFV